MPVRVSCVARLGRTATRALNTSQLHTTVGRFAACVSLSLCISHTNHALRPRRFVVPTHINSV